MPYSRKARLLDPRWKLNTDHVHWPWDTVERFPFSAVPSFFLGSSHPGHLSPRPIFFPHKYIGKHFGDLQFDRDSMATTPPSIEGLSAQIASSRHLGVCQREGTSWFAQALNILLQGFLWPWLAPVGHPQNPYDETFHRMKLLPHKDSPAAFITGPTPACAACASCFLMHP